MAKLREVLGHNLKRIRKAAGLQQEELAVKAGTTVTTISSVENGRNATNIDLLESISKVLKCQPSTLLIPEVKADKISSEEAHEAAMLLKKFFSEQGDQPEDIRRAVFEMLMKS